MSIGINIFGKCNGKDCIARKKNVIVPLGRTSQFDLINEKEKLLCPKCESFIIPKTVGFYCCEYKVSGIKLEDSIHPKPFEFNGIADSKNSIKYFYPVKNGNTFLAKLEIEVTKFLD